VGVSRINLTIDHLVLRGFDPAERQALVDALRGEIAQALATSREWRSHRTPVLRLGQMALAPGISGARKLGQGVARAIGKGLKP